MDRPDTRHGPTAALVTGAARNIGAAVARRLAAAGEHVLIHWHSDRTSAEQVLADVTAEGGTGELVGGDLADPAFPARVAAALDAGAVPLRVIVHNAAAFPLGTLADSVEDDLDRALDTGVRAVVRLHHALSPRLVDGGRIVAVTSGAAGVHLPGTGLYGAGKAALDRVVLALAAELGPRGITANLVSPGAVTTPQDLDAAAATVLGRAGRPEDVAGAVAFLTGPDAGWITGVTLRVDGGFPLALPALALGAPTGP